MQEAAVLQPPLPSSVEMDVQTFATSVGGNKGSVGRNGKGGKIPSGAFHSDTSHWLDFPFGGYIRHLIVSVFPGPRFGDVSTRSLCLFTFPGSCQLRLTRGDFSPLTAHRVGVSLGIRL